jgi:hypothetical protein
MNKISYSYEGVGSDGSMLEPGSIYHARPTLDQTAEDWDWFRASRTGSLFSMWRVNKDGVHIKGTGYFLPQHMEFDGHDSC